MVEVIDQTQTSSSCTNYLVQVANADYGQIELRILAQLKELGYSEEDIRNNNITIER